jgi:hypothetical protein
VSRSVRSVSDATFVDVVLGCATMCVVEFHAAAAETEPDDWLTAFSVANPWLSCARLDVSSSPRTAQTYSVTALPTYLVFQRGAVVASAARAADLPALLALEGDHSPSRQIPPPTTVDSGQPT